ncbi:MAG: cupin domain-containing protein [Clostridia bacterium]
MKEAWSQEVVSLRDLAALAFEMRRPGYARALLHEDSAMRASMLKIGPGGCVPAHRHSNVHDHFFGIKGELEIRCDGTRSLLAPGGYCCVPPRMTHDVRNLSEWHDAYCLLVHTGPGRFDFVEGDRP